ncbi:MAG: hypothetical protein QF717_16390, partial [SAR202 cluster bacterium]|nr:hypothetical protein [SAR202 cluster bacterium]
EGLASQLEDYTRPAMPSSQRRFLYEALRRVIPALPPSSTGRAEAMAARYLEKGLRTDEANHLVPDQARILRFSKTTMGKMPSLQ